MRTLPLQPRQRSRTNQSIVAVIAAFQIVVQSSQRGLLPKSGSREACYQKAGYPEISHWLIGDPAINILAGKVGIRHKFLLISLNSLNTY
jgi:hypothetical protein